MTQKLFPIFLISLLCSNAFALEKKKSEERISLDSSPTFKEDSWEVTHQKIEEEKIMLQNQITSLDYSLQRIKADSQKKHQRLNEKTKTLSKLISRFYWFCQNGFSALLTQSLSFSSLIHVKMFFEKRIKELEQSCIQIKGVLQDITQLEKTMLEKQKEYQILLIKAEKEIEDLREKRVQQLEESFKKYKLDNENNSYTMALVMPASGKLILPSKKIKKAPKKIQIETDYSTEVVAPTYGTVRYTGPLGGSSHAIIIDHGGGYHSILSNLESFSVSIGKPLYPGEPIGRMAGYGKHHPVLTFEFRGQEGELDPLPGLRRGGLS